MKVLDVLRQIKILIIAATTLLATNSWSAQESPQSFTFQGRIASGGTPISGTVNMTLSILDSNEKCILYEESFSGIDVGTSGTFSVKAGTGTVTSNSPAAAAYGGSFSFAKVFANDGSTIGSGSALKSASASNPCSGTYTSASGHQRYLKVVINNVTMTPNISINSMPYSIVAETLQGLAPSDFVKVGNANFTTLTDGSDASLANLHNHDNAYVKIGDTANVNLGSGSSYTTGKLAVGTNVAPNATSPQASVSNSGAANPVMIVQGKVGQTADLAQFTNSTGTVLAGVSASGQWSGDGSLLTGVSGTDSNKVLKAGDSMTGALSVSVNGGGASAVSSTSSGTSAIAIDGTANSGYGVYGSSSTSYGVFGTTSTGQAGNFRTTGAATNPTTAIKGGTSTGKLTSWLNSTGTTIAYVDKDGKYSGDASGATNIKSMTSWTTGTRPGSPSVGTSGFNTTTGYLETYTGSGWSDYSAGSGTGDVLTNQANTFVTGNQAITISNSSHNGLTIAGAAGQTAALQQWKDSTNAVLASVNSSGQWVGNGSLLTGITVATANTFASNPSDCSAGQFATTIAASGNLTCAQVDFSDLSGTSNVAIKNTANTFATGGQEINISTTSDPGLVITGPTGGGNKFMSLSENNVTSASVNDTGTWSGNLTGLATKASAFAANPADCSGNTFATAIDDQGNLTCSQPAFSDLTGSLSSGQLPSTIVKTDAANAFTSTGQAINIATNTHVGLTIKGAASQSGNLLEFKNSNGTVLSQITSDGNIVLPTWTTANRPSSPVTGTTGFNSTVGYTETYTGSAWVNYSAGSGGAGGDLLADGSVSMAGNFNLNSHKLINVTDPTSAQDGATKNYADTTFAKTAAGNTFTVGPQIINIATTTDVGLTVKGAATQSANLWELKNNGGTVLYSIETTGTATAANDLTNKSYVDTRASTQGTLYVKKDGTVAMTGDLNMGTHLVSNVTDPTAAQDAATKNYVDTKTFMLAQANTTAVGGQNINIATNTNTGLTIRGASGQTANLLNFKNSTGTVLSGIDSTGAFTGTIQGTAGTMTALSSDPTDCGANQFATTIAANGNLTCSQPGFTDVTGTLDSLQIPNNVAKNYMMNTFTVGGQVISNSATNQVGLTVKGAPSQAFALSQWKNSTGTVLASVNKDGKFTGDGSLITNVSGTITALTNNPADCGANQFATTIAANGDLTCAQPNMNQLSGTLASSQLPTNAIAIDKSNYISVGGQIINIGTATDVGLTVKGASSQTVPLTQWKNSTGTVLSSISISTILTGAATLTGDGSQLTNLPTFSLAASNIFTVGGQSIALTQDEVALTIRGANGQTAHLQDWANSGGTVLSYIDKDGNVVAPSISGYSGSAYTGITAWSSGAYGIKGSSSSSNSGFFKAASGQSNTTATVVVRQNDTQAATVNLLEIKNSTGTSMASIDGNGMTSVKKAIVGSTDVLTINASAPSPAANLSFTLPADGTNGYYLMQGSSAGSLSWVQASPTPYEAPWVGITFGDNGVTGSSSWALPGINYSTAETYMPFNGYVRGVACGVTSHTGGTVTCYARINGTSVMSCSISSVSDYSCYGTVGTNLSFSSTDLISSYVTTNAFTPTSSDITLTIWVAKDQ